MRKFSISIWVNLTLYYNHYLSDGFINEGKRNYPDYFKRCYPLMYYSRGFDKPAEKQKNACIWCLDDKRHRVGKPALIEANGDVAYFENGEKIK